MEPLAEYLRWAQSLVFLLVGVQSLRIWRRRRDEQSRWLAATFGSLAAIAVVGMLLDIVSADTEVVERPLVAILVLFPYLLLRFGDSFEPVPRTLRTVVGWWVLALAVIAVVMPEWPEPGAAYPPLLAVYVVAVVASWVAVLPVVGWRLWAAGRTQPTVARRRLRLIGVAVVALSVALVASAAENAPAGPLVQALGLVAAVALLVGFTPPPLLRQLWRQREEAALHSAALELMATVSEQDVANVLLPHLRSVVASRGVALVHRGHTLGVDGSTPGLASIDGDGRVAEGVVTCPLREGRIHVWTDRYTPLFGDDELHLLERTALLADLALHRSSLLESERTARVQLERTNAELESFVYSASHDLKSPLITMLSYVDLLVEEHRDGLGEEGRRYLDRLAANGRYMEALIADLLELSRVGRTQTAPERVPLTALVSEVAAELQADRPGLTVEVGLLPEVWMNGVRARQLFTNLLENAAKHAEGPAVSVTVETLSSDPDDGTVLRVSDDGPGIPAAYRERVFGVFERLQTDEDVAGTGIGLAICRKVVEAVGGRIWLADRDVGAEFRIAFPSGVVVASRPELEPVLDRSTEAMREVST